MKKELIAKLEETIEELEYLETNLEQLKRDVDYKEVKIANTYVQRAKKSFRFVLY